jgi:hypothetical protein
MDQGIATEDLEQEVRAVCKVEDNVITYVDDSPSGSAFLLLSSASNWTFEDNIINGGGHELLAGIALYPGIVNEVGIQEGNVFSDNVVFNADFVLDVVFVDSSAQPSDNEFVGNELENISGDGFFIDGDWNRLLVNKFGDVTGDAIILKGNRNLVRESAFHNIGGQHIVDEGVGNVIGEGDPTLIAHWALDETEGMFAVDSAGDNNAVVLGGIEWQPSGGQIDGALKLDGVSGYAITGLVLNPADGPFSVFTWINGGAPGQVVISQQFASNWFSIDTEGNLMMELKSSDQLSGPLMSETVITDGQWHCIGFVWDGTNRALYVDDILVAEDTQDNLQGSDGGFYIGTGKDMEPGTFWAGLIDDVRIYNRSVRP